MMNILRANISQHRQACTQSLQQILRSPIASLLTIAVIAVALALPTSLWTLLQNGKTLSASWQHSTQISLFLKKTLSNERQSTLLATIRALPSVAYLNTISPEQGLKLLEQQGGMVDVLRHLPDNPLPGVIEVFPSEGLSGEQLRQLSQQLASLDGVNEAKLDMQWVKRLYAIIHFLQQSMNLMMACLGIAVLLLVGHTIHLATVQRRQEVEVLKLIGATDRFIRRPFLYGGLIYGLTGAVIAWLAVIGLTYCLQVSVSSLARLYHTDFILQGLSLKQGSTLLMMGACLGYAGARMAVSRQIRAFEPEYPSIRG